MPYQHIKYEVEERIATITLNRPEKLNAFTATMREELIGAFGRADEDDEVRVIIVTGAGRAFCAGADLSKGGDTFHFDDSFRDGGGQVSLRIFESKKPVIGAINGAGVGIGVTMTLPMDIRIASTNARFGFVFSRRGVVPEACSSWFLPRIVGISQALEWVFSGRVFDAAEALAGGLVKEVVPPEDLLDRAREIAREIADNTSAVSVALSRQMMWRMLGADHPMEAHKIDSRGIAQMGRASDVREGVESFLEKRPPNFSMKPSTDMPAFYPWWPEREYE
ncbi:MAG: crotonase/enoyl-CoA hydratase family protein [Proteobacteria bacterium]|nr:crotonase/enoyl-CoA hydratase family protein [Pseudomonadota bacterium]MDA1308720.1 crotonase/enoyl-CoA hydratase family protein [Pseudomonadota bacterium]